MCVCAPLLYFIVVLSYTRSPLSCMQRLGFTTCITHALHAVHVCSIRIFPQQQDTGGFFITLIRKIAPITKLDVHLAGMCGYPCCPIVHYLNASSVWPVQVLASIGAKTSKEVHAVAGKYASGAEADDLDDTSKVGEEAEAPQEAGEEAKPAETSQQQQPQGRGKKKQQFKKEEPFIFLDSDAIYNGIKCVAGHAGIFQGW